MRLDDVCRCGCFNKFENQEVDFIKVFDNWVLYLHFKQFFLGRSLLILKRHETQFDKISKEELNDFFNIYCLWAGAIKKIVSPYDFNISLSNTEKHIHGGHVHLHLVPRYDSPIIFEKQAFYYEDENKKKSPYNLVGNQEITDSLMRLKIKERILAEINLLISQQEK